MKPRIVEIRKGVLEKNDLIAGDLRNRFTTANILVLNLVSSPGAGKTYFLEETMRALIEKGYKVAALVGDLATENDAARLARSGANVRQITTSGNCHLEADMVTLHLQDWDVDVDALDFLFIENVGNLVCPSHYDLGENIRAVLLSVTEGEDKPLKYPPMFNSSDVAVITKVDIAEAVEFDRETAIANVKNVGPELTIFETSAKTGTGMDTWLDYLVEQQKALHESTEA